MQVPRGDGGGLPPGQLAGVHLARGGSFDGARGHLVLQHQEAPGQSSSDSFPARAFHKPHDDFRDPLSGKKWAQKKTAEGTALSLSLPPHGIAAIERIR